MGVNKLSEVLLYTEYVILIVLCFFLIISLVNITSFSKLRPIQPITFNNLLRSNQRTESPLVSLLVPARNEERLIRECIGSLVQQDYVNYEVIVLNDGSTDRTGTILAELSKEYPDKLTVINGKDLPKHWVGKNWACHNLSKIAQGEILLFTDADTIHKPDMIRASVTLLISKKLDFFSMIPFEEMRTFGEKTIIPMIHYLYFAYLPNILITKSRRTSVSAANGQFMCFRKSAYNAIGGHESVKSNLVEDVFLAKEVKKHGMRMALVDGTDFVSCRMYTNFSESFKGFSKNLYAGFSFDLPLFSVFIVHLILLYVFPLTLPLMYAFGIGDSFTTYIEIPAIILAIPIIIRLLIAYRFKLSIVAAFLHFLTAAFSVAICINSLRWAYSKSGVQWKNRSYHV